MTAKAFRNWTSAEIANALDGQKVFLADADPRAIKASSRGRSRVRVALENESLEIRHHNPENHWDDLPNWHIQGDDTGELFRTVSVFLSAE